MTGLRNRSSSSKKDQVVNIVGPDGSDQRVQQISAEDVSEA